MRIAARFIPFQEPEIIEGSGRLSQVVPYLKNQNLNRLLIVTDQGMIATHLLEPLLQQLHTERIDYFLFDQTTPNPTIDTIEDALGLYHSKRCEALLAFGGGSPIDCAKAIAARVANQQKTLPQMKGLFKVGKSGIPPFIAIPTTAGTGSEATLAAVITNATTSEKYALMDPALTPKLAVLDPLLTVGLPKPLTAATGMDALTHVIEAYIGKSTTRTTRSLCLESIQLIFRYLHCAYQDGSDLEARAGMQKAAYLAGKAFSRSYVGNIHAVAHTLGGYYGTPHGIANAIILPSILREYGSTIIKPLSELADAAGITERSMNQREKAQRLIEAIEKLNKDMQIPSKTKVLEKDIQAMAKRAYSEANPLYPVPVIFSKKQFQDIYYRIKA